MWGRCALAVLVFALAGCAGVEVTAVSSDRVSVRTGTSFAFADPAGTIVADDPVLTNEIFRSRFEGVLERMLIERGLTRGAPETAVLRASYEVRVERRREIVYRARDYYPPYAGLYCDPLRRCWGPTAPGGYWGPPYWEPVLMDTRERRIVLDLMDSASGALVWRGVHTQRVSADDAAPERLEEALRRLLQALPLAPATP